VRVHGGDDVEEAGDDDEARALVGDSELDRVAAQAHGAAYDVEQSAAEIAKKAEHFENVVRVGVEAALHGQSEGKHADDGDRQKCPAPPFAKEKMPGAWNEPACDKR